MGQNQPKKKTEEEIRNDMRRKWENFGKTQSSKNEENNISNNDQNSNNINQETINNNTNIINKINEENIPFKNEHFKKEEKSKSNEENLLPLIPPNEEDKPIEKLEEENKIIPNYENDKEENNNIQKEMENANNENLENEKMDSNEIEKKEEEIKPIKKNIDYENTTIEKVFHITLDEDNPKKYLFLEFYLAKLLSLDQPPSFKLQNLDDIILLIMNEPSIKKNLLNYFLECFHRAYEIIEVRFKDVLGPEYAQIHLAIATYFGQIVSSPENFEINISKKEISELIRNYYLKAPESEFLFLFKDITLNCGDDIESLSQVLHYLFEIIHKENLNGQTFFKGSDIKKNLNLLLRILQDYPKVREVFLNDILYNPLSVNGRLKQALSFFGPYISYSPLDTPNEQQRTAFKQFTNDSETKSYINKLNNIIEVLNDIVIILDEYNDEKTLDYFFSIINLNIDWQKTMKNFMILSSLGFLLNTLFLCLNLFFYECHIKFGNGENNKNKDYKIKVIKYINTKFCLNDKKIFFSKFNYIISVLNKDYLEENKHKSESINYNIITKLFFICHSLMNYVLPSLMKFYMETNKAASQAFASFGFNDPKTKDFIIKMRLFDIYVKNDKFIKYILEFNEITAYFLITLNNTKYSHNDDYKEENNKNDNINQINEDEFYEFKNDFFNYMDGSTNIVISSLPEFCILNIVNSTIFFRQAYPDLFFRDFDLVKNLTNFALIYSSRIDIIHNRHLRSQIFDILLYSFHMDEREKNNNHILYIHQKLLKENFVKENLMFSLMRVFIDAERLGTANQYYEKYNIRNKVLQLVNEVFKKNQVILTENIINYANKHSEEAYNMITLLMGDVSVLSDNVIERLNDIKKYQDLKDNKEEWNSLSDEEKKGKDDNFNENDRYLKSECRLLNQSLGFMTIICSCLQKYFLEGKNPETLANILNHCLDNFTSKSSELKIKNKKDYEFNPSYIMESLIKIYSYFDNYEEFIEWVVTDERSYKYDNFLKAIKVKNDFNKVKIDSEISEKFDDFVYNKLKIAMINVEKNEINYDDAPKEFFDPLFEGIMDDPVILPASHVSVDRKNIEKYLLDYPADPYNRTPLTKEELIPNVELKKRIDEYKLNKTKKLGINIPNIEEKNNKEKKDNFNQDKKDHEKNFESDKTNENMENKINEENK